MSINSAIGFNVIYFGDGISTELIVDLETGPINYSALTVNPREAISARDLTRDQGETDMSATVSHGIMTVVFTVPPTNEYHTLYGNLLF